MAGLVIVTAVGLVSVLLIAVGSWIYAELSFIREKRDFYSELALQTERAYENMLDQVRTSHLKALADARAARVELQQLKDEYAALERQAIDQADAVLDETARSTRLIERLNQAIDEYYTANLDAECNDDCGNNAIGPEKVPAEEPEANNSEAVING